MRGSCPGSMCLLALFVCAGAVCPSANANTPPATPTITEPSTAGQIVNPADVHMETAPFSNPDPGDTHVCTDWEIWTVNAPVRVWVTSCISGIEKLHTHLGDGTFVGPYAGRFELKPTTNYELHVRHRDSSGDPATEWSSWATRQFRTSAVLGGSAVPWTFRQPGYRLDVVATGFQLPVAIAFVPSPGPAASDPLFYVAELYGTIKVVRRDETVSVYATNLLNFNPTGKFPGSGEQGIGGLVVDAASGDVFASMLYDAGGPHYPKVVRFHSTDGGRTAASQAVVLDMVGETQGQSHQVSNLSIGPDGKLYVHVGDGFFTAKAQDLTSFRGKILRLELGGSPVATNPFYDASDGITATDYIYAYGFRNPFGGGWRALDASHYEVENGPAVDRLARVVPGRNYLWDGTDASMRNFAIYNWSPIAAPVNLAWIQPQTFGGSGFPTSKYDHLFVSESGSTWATGPQTSGKRISEFVIDANGVRVSGPTALLEYTGRGKATVVALAAGPDGLYFSDFYRDLGYTSPIDPGARILRISPAGSTVPSVTTTTALSGVTPLVAGIPAVATYAVAAPAGSSVSGTVTVSDGTTSCTAAATAGQCTLTFPTSGARTLTASYAGNSTLLPSTSAPLTVTVVGHPSATVISGVSPAVPAPGTPITVRFAVTGLPGVAPTGTVTVSDGSASCTAAATAGQCTLTFPTSGARTLTASYAGNSTLLPSTSAPLTVTVVGHPSATVISGVSPAVPAPGTPITVRFAVTGLPGVAPTGTVTVSDGSASCTAAATAGQCTLTFPTSGARTLTASYAGNSTLLPSTSAPLTVTVVGHPSATVISGVSPAVPAPGTPITVRFAVTGLPGVAPTGTVTVSDGSAGCTANVSAGQCVFTPSAGGTRSLTASYSGNATLLPSTSAVFSLVVGQRTYTLAEGVTGAFWDTFLLVANPNPVAVPVTLTFYREDGTTASTAAVVDADSRYTLWLDLVPQLSSTPGGVATVVTSDNGLPLVVERATYFDASRGPGAYGAGQLSGAHDRTSTTWYFAEGAEGGFETFLLLGNVSTIPAEVTVTYLLDQGASVARTYTVGPTSRLTVAAATEPALAGHSFGISVSSSTPIVADRAVYIGEGFRGGLSEGGVDAPSTTWLFAEGATGPLFDTFLLMANPGSTPAVATVRYHVATGAIVTRTYSVAPQGRTTTWVDLESPELADTTLWMEVAASQPIVAERTMYWPGDGSRPWNEGHVSAGAATAQTSWAFAEGVTGGAAGFQTYLLLANPGATATSVDVQYLPASGAPIVQTYQLAPGERRTVAVHADVPQLQSATFGMRVVASSPILAERSIYWTNGTGAFVGGTNARGTPVP